MKLIKNVYGLKDASKTWFDYISAGLLDYRFTKNQINPCLNVKGNILFCLYVDDAICLIPSKKEADKLIQDLERKGHVLKNVTLKTSENQTTTKTIMTRMGPLQRTPAAASVILKLTMTSQP